MLEIKNINKDYITGDEVVHALRDVTISFRESELVSILGHSGCGKTTLLNIIGGLDRYTSGDLIINGKSTTQYKASDWDTYRNHSVGFIFQSYNLIPHQTVLSNVELALTLSGVSKTERRKRAKEALEKVGLGDQINKKPNQMSGGQMQRVAIARALVNDPDILLADEPTGALDSETSFQIMELIKEIAKDRLVIMVTHNPELAEEYSTRIVRLSDGKITDDTAPFSATEKKKKPKKNKKLSMSFLTALSLSFNNLRTKKGRTLLTSMAGSIGIVGIGLILAVSTGMTEYINSIQKDTMSQYPITIGTEAIDTGALYGEPPQEEDTEPVTTEEATEEVIYTGIYSNHFELQRENIINTVIKENDLASFKTYLDDTNNEIHKYLGEKGIEYTYDIHFNVYTDDVNGKLIDTDKAPEKPESSTGTGNFLSSLFSGGLSSLMGGGSETGKNFNELPEGEDGELFNQKLFENYDLLYGEWPQSFTDAVLVLNRENQISLEEMFSLGLISAEQYNSVARAIAEGTEAPPVVLDYSSVYGKKFYLVTPGNRYLQNTNGTFSYIEEIEGNEASLRANAITLTITGVIKRKADAEGASASGPVAYSPLIRSHIISVSAQSPIVSAQQTSPDVNVLTGLKFTISDENEKISAIKTYLTNMTEKEKASVYKMISILGLGFADTPETPVPEETTVPPTEEPTTEEEKPQPSAPVQTGFLGFIAGIISDIRSSFENIGKLFELMRLMNTLSEKYPEFSPDNIGSVIENFQNIQSGNIEDIISGIDIESIIKDYIGSDLSDLASNDRYFAEQLDKWLASSPDTKMLLTIYDQYIKESSYEQNLKDFGFIDINRPSSVSLYADNFENKDMLAQCIADYNSSADEEKTIKYTDYAAMLTSSLTSIINGISYVLVAFVAISLFVSGIMIGIITHISVMERTKEIGILRALGASKRNISQVFNAETFIIGLFSGLIGIMITLIGIIPINAVIEIKTGIENLDAQLPFASLVGLMIVSIVITLTGGLIPALNAAKKDPVVALRTE